MSTTTEYRTLLAKYLPRPIRSEQDYQRSMRQLESLMTPKPGIARSLLIEMLSTLIEQYESRTLPNPGTTPAQMLSHLLDVRGIKQAELARLTGISPATISSVLAGQRGISKGNAITLARHFKVSPQVFLAPGSEPISEPTVG